MHAFSASQLRLPVCKTWTVAHQSPLFMKLVRQVYWNVLPFSSPGNLLNPGIKPIYLASPSMADGFFITRGN